MAKYFVPGVNGLIDDERYQGTIPLSARQITDELYEQLQQAQKVGKRIATDANNMPAIVDFSHTEEETIAWLTGSVQRHLDATVKNDRGYDNIYTACTYADEPSVPKFQAEGQAARAWRSQVWAYCNQVLADVHARTRTPPTAEQLISELPQIVWPQ